MIKRSRRLQRPIGRGRNTMETIGGREDEQGLGRELEKKKGKKRKKKNNKGKKNHLIYRDRMKINVRQ